MHAPFACFPVLHCAQSCVHQRPESRLGQAKGQPEGFDGFWRWI
jgi:hypothetical protein